MTHLCFYILLTFKTLLQLIGFQSSNQQQQQHEQISNKQNLQFIMNTYSFSYSFAHINTFYIFCSNKQKQTFFSYLKAIAFPSICLLVCLFIQNLYRAIYIMNNHQLSKIFFQSEKERQASKYLESNDCPLLSKIHLKERKKENLNYYYNLAVVNNIFQCLNVAFIQRERERV